MDSKNLIIAFIWIFVLVSVVLLYLEDFGMSFAGYVIFFVIALVSTLAVEAIIPDKMKETSETRVS
jgi:hypothetical protein